MSRWFWGISPCFSGGYGSGGGGVASTPVTVQYLRVVRPVLTVGTLSSLTFFVGTTFLLSDVDAMRQEKIERKKDHTVYKLVDSDGYPQYVGRTTDVDARKNAHKRDPNRSHLNFEVIAPNLNYFEARGLEQIAMMECHTLNTANRMNNQINGISPFNKRLGIYMEAGRGVAHYLGNNISNEILYWTGN